MVPAQINYWAVLVSGLVGMAVGAVWYSPKAFGKTWLALLGLTGSPRQTTNQMAKQFFNTFIALLVMSYIMAHFVDYVSATTIAEGLVTGLWTWLGFVATTTLINGWFERRPLQLALINGGYFLVVLVISGAILAVWS